MTKLLWNHHLSVGNRTGNQRCMRDTEWMSFGTGAISMRCWVRTRTNTDGGWEGGWLRKTEENISAVCSANIPSWVLACSEAVESLTEERLRCTEVRRKLSPNHQHRQETDGERIVLACYCPWKGTMLLKKTKLWGSQWNFTTKKD